MKPTLVIGILVYLLSSCSPSANNSTESLILTQELLDRLAEKLDVQYTVVANKSSGDCTPEWGENSCFVSDITFSLPFDTKATGWEIYYSQADKFELSDDEEFNLKRINGDLVRITPSENYKGFKAGERKRIRTFSAGLNLTDAKVMPNYYIVGKGLKARIISSTKLYTASDTGLEIRPYATTLDGATQFQRDNDNTPLATSSYLFEQNKSINFDKSAVAAGIIPKPKSLILSGGELDLTSGINIEGGDDAVIASGAAFVKLRKLGVNESANGTPFSVEIDSSISSVAGAYILTVTADTISVVGIDSEGVANGVRSVAALKELGTSKIPLLVIEDEPRYPYRGMHVDLARNFHSKEFVLSLIEQMAAYKLNKLHLHLGDDEGWRLEVRGFPELTEVGGFRCHDLEENTCLLPQLGSGPDPKQNPGVNGYLTIDDYKELLHAATARHIQVIPSFDMPGHSRALIKSMEVRYRRFMAEGKEAEALKYRLIDPLDTTEYSSIQNYNDNTINVCAQSSYDFIDKIIEEMKIVHNEAGHPLTTYHIGADETAGAWVDSNQCKQYMSENGITEVKELGAHFIERVAEILNNRGIGVAGWSDGLSHTHFDKMPKSVQSNIWDVLVWGGTGNLNKQVNAGWDVVLSTPDALYFDFPHEADPKEPGYYWGARRINSRKVFNFMPGNVPVLAEMWKSPSEQPIQIDDSKPIEKGKSIVGIQGQIWSETLRSDNWAEYQIYPRLLTLAERAWHKPAWEPDYNYAGGIYNKDTHVFTDTLKSVQDKDWQRFASILSQKELFKLDDAGVFYRIPTVGALVDNRVLHANSIWPGIKIEYRIDNADWETYSGPVALDSWTEGMEIRVRSRSVDGKRLGRILLVE